MELLENISYYACHVAELRYIIQWKLTNTLANNHPIKAPTATQETCFAFLDSTGRSFSAVIKALHPELLFPVSIFYLALRGLDTIEDDPSIPPETKEPLLRRFVEIMEMDGWAFHGNRPEEHDRELLVHFNAVITEFKKLKPVYQDIIKEVIHKMGNGMADYTLKASEVPIQTIPEYNRYCFYVAGLVGHGLTRLFVEANLADPVLLNRSDLQISMGLFLQKTNIIRDVQADFHDSRRFWPGEIWRKHVDDFEDLFRLEPEYHQAALKCSLEMILNALSHVKDCLMYLSFLDEKSIFTFCAAPQGMAIATLELCFRNQDLFQEKGDGALKISKGDACRIMLESSWGMDRVLAVFRRYIGQIREKNQLEDPSSDGIGEVCDRIEKSIQALSLARTQTDIDARWAIEKRDLTFFHGLLAAAAVVVPVIFLAMGSKLLSS